MKNTAKILVLVLTLALLTVGLVIGTSAAESYTDAYNQVNINLDESLAGATYLVYPSEDAFKADAADHVINGTGATKGAKSLDNWDCSYDKGYVYLLRDAYLYRSSTGISLNGSGEKGNVIYDLGGHYIYAGEETDSDNMKQFTIHANYGTVEFRNGEWRHCPDSSQKWFSGGRGIFDLSAGSVLTFTNVTISANCGFAQVNGNVDVTFNNCRLAIGYNRSNIFLATNQKVNITYNNTSLTGSWSNDNNANTPLIFVYAAGANVDMKFIGKSSCLRTDGVVYEKTEHMEGNPNINVYFSAQTTVESTDFARYIYNTKRAQTYTGAGVNYYIVDDDLNTNTVYAKYYQNAELTGDSVTCYSKTFNSYMLENTIYTYAKLENDMEFNDDQLYGKAIRTYTIDLNGKTLTNTRTEGSSRLPNAKTGFTYTMKNGKYVTAIGVVCSNNSNNQGTVVFENVDITQSGWAFETQVGTVIVRGGSINTTATGHGTAALCDNNIVEGAKTTVAMYGTKVTGRNLTYYAPHAKTTEYTFIFARYEGETDWGTPEFDGNRVFTYGHDSDISASNSYNVTIKDALLHNTGAFAENNIMSVTTTENYNLSNVKLYNYNAPQKGTVTLGEGERLMTLTGDDTYNYVVDTPVINTDAIKVNLSLYSYFKINVFVPVTGTNIAAIDGVELGEVVEIQNIEGTDYYAIPLTAIVAPTTALDKVTFSYGYTDADDGEGVYRSLDVKYSVYNYFASYFAENTNEEDLGYILNKDAMVYIQAAYALDRKTGTAFDALIGDYASEFAFDGTKDEAPKGGVLVSGTFDTSGSTVVLMFEVTEDVPIWINVGNECYVATNSDKANCKEISLRAYALANNFTINVGGETVATYTYSLDAYYNRTVAGMNAEQEALVRALGAFAKSAQLYKQAAYQA